jgi:hypothetical protein
VIAVRVTARYGLRLAICGPARRSRLLAVSCYRGGSGEVGGGDVGGLPVQTAAGAVVTHGRAGIGVRGGFLDIPGRNPGVEGGGDERMPQRVRPGRLADPGAAGHPADDPRGTVPIQPLPAGGQEDRTFHPLADGQADRPVPCGVRAEW